MGIISGLMGNATEVTPQEIHGEIADTLAPQETIERAFRLIRDLIIFTDKRLIFVDKQGVTGKKTSFHSIPYKSISHFSVETAGHLDFDSELYIFLMGSSSPIRKLFRSKENIVAIQQTLAAYVLSG